MGTFLVLCVLGVICFFAIRSMIADSKAGRCSGCSKGCSCGSGCCSASGSGHNAKKLTETHKS